MECARCNKDFNIKDMRYNPYDNNRMCVDCFNKYRQERLSVKFQENEELEAIELEKSHAEC